MAMMNPPQLLSFTGLKNEAMNLIFFASSVTASLCYCYFLSSKIPKGIYRFISLIPVLYLFTILPLRFSYIFTTAVSASLITWLTNFKLLQFAFDLDQSPLRFSDSLLRFIAVAALPVKVKTNTNSTSVNANSFKLGFQMLIFAILVSIVQNYRDQFHPKIILIVYCGLLFLVIDVVSAVMNFVILFLIGIELESSFNEPYLATSLQDFWGRWNLMVTNSLRHTVYKPIRSVFPDKEWAPLAGIFGSFVVSGLMHELLVWQISREEPTWEMTSFFVLHGFCVVVELGVKRALAGGRWRLPEFVRRMLTLGFVAATCFWLFFPPLIRSRLDVKVIDEYMLVPRTLKTKLFVF